MSASMEVSDFRIPVASIDQRPFAFVKNRCARETLYTHGSASAMSIGLSVVIATAHDYIPARDDNLVTTAMGIRVSCIVWLKRDEEEAYQTGKESSESTHKTPKSNFINLPANLPFESAK